MSKRLTVMATINTGTNNVMRSILNTTFLGKYVPII
jgi:hypothetical protein